MILREIFPLPNGIMMNYQITLPTDYVEGEKLPMIVFLHGAGERGDNFDRLCNTAVSKVFAKDQDYKGLRVITLCPQCLLCTWALRATECLCRSIWGPLGLLQGQGFSEGPSV